MIKYKRPKIELEYWVVSLVYSGMQRSADFEFRHEEDARRFVESARKQPVNELHENGNNTIFFPDLLVCATVAKHEARGEARRLG